MTLVRCIGLSAALLGTVFMAGCAHRPAPLYHWGEYQPQVYEYFKGDGKSYEEQIIALEADIQKARSAGTSLPPGYHAHLGLLYLKAGKDNQVKQQFETEKTLYPESSSFMDFLLIKFNK